MKEPRILPECHADTLLAEVAGFKANHQPNINEVAKTMQNNFKGTLAIGIVDADKRIPHYFETFLEERADNGFILKKHPTLKHYLIVLSPAFEKWVFDTAAACEIDPKKFGFRDVKHFMESSKKRDVARNQHVRSFLNAIKQKPDNTIMKIRQCIENLLDNE